MFNDSRLYEHCGVYPSMVRVIQNKLEYEEVR